MIWHILLFWSSVLSVALLLYALHQHIFADLPRNTAIVVVLTLLVLRLFSLYVCLYVLREIPWAV